MECFGAVSGRTVQSQNFGTEHLNFWTVFEQFGTHFWTGCAFFFLYVIVGKMNNMLVV